MTASRHLVGAYVLLLFCAGLGGCGDDNDTGAPPPIPSATMARSSTPTVTDHTATPSEIVTPTATPGQTGTPTVSVSRRTGCGPLAVAPDVVEPIELLWGATNVDAAVGSGALTAGFSSCGELTVLKWPGPSYYDQIDYLSSNEADARLMPHFGALETQGAFAGLSLRMADGLRRHVWLRDPAWRHRQRYESDDSGVLVHETLLESLGLRVTARHFVLPERDVLVNAYTVAREESSPVEEARLLFYANFAPTRTRLPFFPVADWGLDYQNDFAVLFDSKEDAFLHFLPESADGTPRDYGLVNGLLAAPPEDPDRLQQEVDALARSLDEPGIYIAFGARDGDAQHQAGFDDGPTCAHQTRIAERTLALQPIPPGLLPVIRQQFLCEVNTPGGPLAHCREENGWTYAAESAYSDAEDGELSGSPLAACQANAALSTALEFAAGEARATFYVTAAGTRAEAYALLDEARAAGPDEQREETGRWWREFLSNARLPATDDPLVTAFAKRTLISARTAADRASGAIVASIATQSPYGEDWPRDGAFINDALDRAGLFDLVSAHNRFYTRVQRREPGAWSPFYSFPPCNPDAPVYPDCIPPGTFEQNYYADPDEIVPGGPTSFEIDQAGLGVWTLWNHASHLEGEERAAYLEDVCPAIRRGAASLAACRDQETGLQCAANEDDNFELTQGLQGAETVLLALESGIEAAASCGFDAVEVDGWEGRARDLRAAILERFLAPGPPAHLEGGRAAWALWPARVLPSDDPVAHSHAEWLGSSLERLLERSVPRSGYDAQNLLARAVYFRAVGDEAGLAETREQVRFFVRELTTPDTLHMGEFYVRVQADLNGDGAAPDYLQSNAVPHIWEQSFLYAAAMEAFGGR